MPGLQLFSYRPVNARVNAPEDESQSRCRVQNQISPGKGKGLCQQWLLNRLDHFRSEPNLMKFIGSVFAEHEVWPVNKINTGV